MPRGEFGTFGNGAMREWENGKLRLPGWLLDVVSIATAVRGLIQGVELFISPPSRSEVNLMVVGGLGQQFYGAMLFTISCYLVFSLVYRKIIFYMSSHAIASVGWLMYAVALAGGIYESGPPFYGLRFLVAALSPCVVMAAFFVWQNTSLKDMILASHREDD